MIRHCGDEDFEEILGVINDGAQVYKGLIPEDRWREPYMSRAELRREIADGVRFWGEVSDGRLIGAMGMQDVDDVTLIRHAYVRTGQQGSGVGSRLLEWLRPMARGPLLIGTWAASARAIRFYERHGFVVVAPKDKERLLRRYWRIPERQIETSVVLAELGKLAGLGGAA